MDDKYTLSKVFIVMIMYFFKTVLLLSHSESYFLGILIKYCVKRLHKNISKYQSTNIDMRDSDYALRIQTA